MNYVLPEVARNLQAMEDTIVFSLLNRAQFLHNPGSYKAGATGLHDYPKLNMLEARLIEHDKFDARLGRFSDPEEQPVAGSIPAQERPLIRPPSGLRQININLNPDLLPIYISLMGKLCKPGDDPTTYGISSEYDEVAFRAVSRRVHHAAQYVAECKLSKCKEVQHLVKTGDAEGLLRAITRKEVEERIKRRVGNFITHLQDVTDPRLRHNVNPSTVQDFFQQIIGLVKQGEVQYLLECK